MALWRFVWRLLLQRIVKKSAVRNTCFAVLLLCYIYSQQALARTTLVVVATDSEVPVHMDSSQPTVVAYAIVVTHCSLNSTLVDGAAVLAHSIRENSIRTDNASKYDYALYAFLHADAQVCQRQLTSVGYKVIFKTLPFKKDDIRDPNLVEWIEKRGCCGSKEFLKLWTFALTDHPIAVHLDTDTLIMRPLDPVFDVMLANNQERSADSDKFPTQQTDDAKQILQPRVMFNRTISSEADFFFTRDYYQRKHSSANPAMAGVQGGFFILRPNITLFHELQNAIVSATYHPKQGWGGLGYSGYWGASQIQGFLSYFYGRFYPSRSVELNRCYYNAMLDEDIYTAKGAKVCRSGEVHSCQECREVPVDEIMSIHLTLCRKPWECALLNSPKQVQCKAVHQRWFETRKDLELSWGQTPPTDGWQYGRTLGYCARGQSKGLGPSKRAYIPLNISSL